MKTVSEETGRLEDSTQKDLEEQMAPKGLAELTPILSLIAPIIGLLRGEEPPLRAQLPGFLIMLSTLIAITILALNGIIDSSGATGLFGAMIGYVFGSYFHRSLPR